MGYKRASYLVLSLLLLLGVAYLWSATAIRDPGTRGSIGPGYFPVILGVLLIVLCIIALIQTLHRQSDQPVTIPNLGYVLTGLAATVAFLILWGTFGAFYPLAFLFVAGLMTVFKPLGNWRQYALILVASLCLTLAVYGLFGQIMHVRF